MLNYLKKLLAKKNASHYYTLLGQQKGITELVNQFYMVMETDPKAKACLETHELVDGKVPDMIKDKLSFFISGWLGGPNLFVEKIGPPMMRKRHMHIKIEEKERDQWLYCMNIALKNHSSKKLKSKHKIKLANSFAALALRIQNH